MKKFNLLPKESGFSTLYKSEMDPRISNEFASAAFRFGHTMVPETFRAASAKNSTVAKEFKVSQTFDMESTTLDIWKDPCNVYFCITISHKVIIFERNYLLKLIHNVTWPFLYLQYNGYSFSLTFTTLFFLWKFSKFLKILKSSDFVSCYFYFRFILTKYGWPVGVLEWPNRNVVQSMHSIPNRSEIICFTLTSQKRLDRICLHLTFKEAEITALQV